MTDRRHPLSPARIIAFAGPAVPLSLLNLPILTFIGPYYGETLGLGIDACGWVFLVVRTLDAFLDIYVGRFSDALTLRMGRRRAVVAAGVPVLGIASLLLCFPGPHASLVTFGAGVSAFYIGWTLIQVPHMSWGQDLAGNAAERGQMSAWRETGTLIGMLLAASLPIVIPRPPGMDALTHSVRTLGGAGVALLLVTALLALALVPDPPAPVRRGARRSGVLTLLAWPMLAFPIAMFFLLSLGIGIYISAVYLLVGRDLGLAGAFMPFVVIQYVTSIALNRPLTRIARRAGTPLTIACTSTAFCLGILILALARSSWVLGGLGFSLVGVGIGASLVLPPAMIAGLARIRAESEGVDRTGEHLGLLNLVHKLGYAVGMGLGLILYAALPAASPAHPLLSPARIVGCYLPAAVVMAMVACIALQGRRIRF
jgi:glycoside/pentoside/hexuronide:cation symporter, GPH family